MKTTITLYIIAQHRSLSMLYSELQPATKAVYHVITRIQNHKTHRFFWKIKNIATMAGVSYSSVQRAEKELINAGVLKYVRRLPHNVLYEFAKELDLSSMT